VEFILELLCSLSSPEPRKYEDPWSVAYEDKQKRRLASCMRSATICHLSPRHVGVVAANGMLAVD
jgi:hypothetical protein